MADETILDPVEQAMAAAAERRRLAGTVPTVRVAAPDGGSMIINESDYNPERHVLVDAAPVNDSSQPELRGSESSQAGGEALDTPIPPASSSPKRGPGRPRKG